MMEGHAARLAKPLSRRQTRTIWAVLAAVAVLLVGSILYLSLGSDRSRGAGCIDVIVPSSMGAAQLHQCGTAARSWCESLAGRSDAQAAQLLPACRRAGYSSSARAHAGR